MKLILASASPRRRQLLEEAGFKLQVVPADVDETLFADEATDAHVKRLAALKNDKVAALYPDEFVLGADTVVEIDQHIFGKPSSLAEARSMLAQLSGRRHRVMTGVKIQKKNAAVERLWTATTEVYFRELCPQIIDEYCSRVNTLDKAGAYAIQEHGDLLIAQIDGLWSNVVGLPVEEVVAVLQQLNA